MLPAPNPVAYFHYDGTNHEELKQLYVDAGFWDDNTWSMTVDENNMLTTYCPYPAGCYNAWPGSYIPDPSRYSLQGVQVFSHPMQSLGDASAPASFEYSTQVPSVEGA